MTEKVWTQKYLERRCRYWQGRLRLLDWNVTIRFCPQSELDDDAQAKCHWNEHARTCSIKIVNPDEYESALGVKQDIEDTIRHELIHLHFVFLGVLKGTNLILLEQAIESISGAFIAPKKRQTAQRAAN
jgi:hypothetical protein